MNERELPGEELSAGEISAPILPEKPRFSASWQEIAAALACYVLGWIWFDLEQPGWLLVFVAAFIGLTELLHRETPRPRESWVWLGCMLVLTASVVFDRYRAWEDAFFPLFFLHIFAVWWALSRSGRLSFHESVCHSHPEFPETTLPESDRNIMACAMPGLPPELHIVYGNKWIEKRLSPLLQSALPLFLIQTDYVPAFLASPFEVCLYLYLMDYCIIKEDYQKVKDEDLRAFLHIFRPSPMLKIKGLL